MTTNVRLASNLDERKRHRMDRAALILGIPYWLEQLRLEGWSHTLWQFLSVYDGIEYYLPVADDPVRALLAALSEVAHHREIEPGLATQVVQVLEKQRFMQWELRWVDITETPCGPPWRALEREEPRLFWHYCEAKPKDGAKIAVVRNGTGSIDGGGLRRWLIAGYLRHVMKP